MKDTKDFAMIDFSGLRISLASPEKILSWSHGEVTKPETINYRTFKPEKDGLFDERIFGPTKDYECYCGKYKGRRYKGIVCDRCGVEVTTSAVRRERMGHIKLATPIAHIWYFKGVVNPLSLVLDVPPQALERIIYFALYLATDVDPVKQKEAIKRVKEIKEEEIKKIEEEFKSKKAELRQKLLEEKEKTKNKIKMKERRDLAFQEIELKFKEKEKILLNQYVEKKSQKVAYFDRLIKAVRALKKMSTLEEEDYLFLKEKGLEDFVKVGLGAEVLYEMLSTIDLNKKLSELLRKLSGAKGDKQLKLIKKIRVIESFIKAKIDPKWMIMTVLPVLPPDLRPVIQLPGGKFATSDLNDFYRRIINRNNRLKQLIELGAPEIILRNEKRMLQEAVDSLIDLQKTRGAKRTRRRSSKIQKSLSDILKGKQGRFRQNLLGKRVDYSGRSTIIVGSDLKIDQCGIPKEMALELFKPYILHEIIVRGLAPNLKSAKNYLEQRESEVYDILEKVTRDHPVLLNRAPTLHKLSILGFYPVLTDGYAIKLHPTVCAGYNADFDGDAMAVFVPLSSKAIEEVKSRMLPYQNLLKPANGVPIVLPNKEMALGCYYLTTLDSKLKNKKDEELKIFASENEALEAFHLNEIKLRDPIWVRVNGKVLKTSVGRIIFNNSLPEELRFINRDIRAADLKVLTTQVIKLYGGGKKVGEVIDRIKDIGFWAATVASGLSVSIFDCKIIPEKEKLVKETEKKVKEIYNNYEAGLLTEEERRKLTIELWLDTTEKLASMTWDALDEENPAKIIIKSGGARASKEQLKQLAAIKGLVVDPLGKIIEIPTKSNYREGLPVFEYIISARGARKGLTDSALKTANAGYLTRRLVDVAHDVIVREEDCGEAEGLLIEKKGKRGDKFYERIYGRYLARDAKDEKGKVVLKRDDLIDENNLEILKKSGVKKVYVRSPLLCKSKLGVCRKCYGLDLSTSKPVEIGVPVGVVAAQSVGEPGTQLTMRVRHFGGIVISDVTQGLPRVEELFEVRKPKVVSPIAEFDGKVEVKEDEDKDVHVVKIIPTSSQGTAQEFLIPLSQKLRVKDGQLITAGTPLSEGHLDIRSILNTRGLRETQRYILDEVQNVYESQGISIHDKHFEVIIRKMSDKVIIQDEGDTSFIKNEIVSKVRFEEENKKVLSQGGKPADGKISILGITRSAIYTDSWLSAASFEQTTSVLSKAAIKGQVDYLLGLKENVIIGRLIPVTEELINKYYSKFLQKYAHNQSTDKKQEKEEGEKEQSDGSKESL